MKKILNLMIAFVCVLSCSVVFAGCNATRSEHTAGAEWITSDTHHWHECTDCGEKVDMAEHDWKASDIVTEATPTKDGKRIYVCDVCDSSKVASYSITKVTEAEWDNALEFLLFDKVQLSVQIGEEWHALIKDGNLYYIDSNPADVMDGYYLKEGNKYYSYKQQSGIWIRTEIDKNTYEEAIPEIDLGDEFVNMGIDFSDFVYNSESHAYECINFEVYFVNGKTTKFVMNNYDGHDQKSIWTIAYNDIELELPNTTMVNEQIFYSAIDLSTLANAL